MDGPVSDFKPADQLIRDLASVYTRFKQAKIGRGYRADLYVDLAKGASRAFYEGDSKLAKSQGFSRLSDSLLKKIIDRSGGLTVDPKTQRAAAKALLYLPWKHSFDEELVESLLPAIAERTSGELGDARADTLAAMLGKVEALTRSREGGNGVFFISAAPEANDRLFPGGVAIVKFAKADAGQRTAFADRFLRAMGFETPQSKRIGRKSTIGEQVTDAILTRLDELPPDRHESIRLQARKLDSVLVMRRVPGLTLRQIPEPDLLRLLADEQFLERLGEMIFIDAFMGNPDRLSEANCNLGNIMVNLQDSSLSLVDSEFCLNKVKPDHVASLTKLLKGGKTLAIVQFLAEALEFDRKDLGGVKLDSDQTKLMTKSAEKGIHRGASKLRKVLAQPEAVRRLFQFPSHTSEYEASIDLIKKLQKHIKTV